MAKDGNWWTSVEEICKWLGGRESQPLFSETLVNAPIFA
jgi:hypothetical protein